MSELHRFTRQLVESLSSHDPSAVASPVSLDDITTRVLPYRACRRLFGILNVEDYDLLLLRLVAGEGGLAAGSPLAAVERCRAELDMGHPDPGVVNQLEGVSLRLDLGAIALGEVVSEESGGAIVRSYTLYEPEADAEAEPEQELEATQGLHTSPVESTVAEAAETPAEDKAISSSEPAAEFEEPMADEAVEFDFVDTPAPASDDALSTPEPAGADREPEPEADPFQELFDAPGAPTEPEPEVPEPPVTAPPEPVAPPPPAAHGEPPPRCPHCASRLPSGRPVRFCPHCGSNVVPLQCVSCGAGLEPAWRHCVLCGAPAVNDSRFA